MSRVFTVSFSFKEKTYTALVAFGPRGHGSSCLVKYLDPELNQLVPGNQFEISLREPTGDTKTESKFAEDLLVKTTQAITGYLKSHKK